MEASACDLGKPEKAAGNTVRQLVTIKQGIGQEVSKRIVKELKGSKLKVQAAIQGDSLRITGKKRDDLQDAIALVKSLKIDQPLQYENFRDSPSLTHRPAADPPIVPSCPARLPHPYLYAATQTALPLNLHTPIDVS